MKEIGLLWSAALWIERVDMIRAFFGYVCANVVKLAAQQRQFSPRMSPQREHVLLPFLKQQSQAALSRLYSGPSSCLSVFR